MAIHWTNSESVPMVSLGEGREGSLLAIFFYLTIDIA